MAHTTQIRHPSLVLLYLMGFSTAGWITLGGLGVTMDDPSSMGSVKSIGDLNSERQHGLDLQRLAADAVLQRQSVQKLHDDERTPIVLTISWMVQMFGWFSAEAARASRRKRSSACGS